MTITTIVLVLLIMIVINIILKGSLEEKLPSYGQ